MNRLERVNNLNEALLAALTGWQSKVWTALPGIVQSWSPDPNTVTVQPAMQAKVESPDGSESFVSMPLLLDVPVMFQRGGGYTLTFPIAEGDECLVIFASRCIDSWWQQGGPNNVPAMIRMHDLSDGFALVGPWSVPKKVANVSANSVQLRSDDGEAYVELAGGHIVNIVAPGGVNIVGNVNVTGTVVATGEGTFNGGHTVSQHVHGGVQPGSGNTAVPHG